MSDETLRERARSEARCRYPDPINFDGRGDLWEHRRGGRLGFVVGAEWALAVVAADTKGIALLTEIIRVEMSKGAYQMLPDELPYESAARRVAAAVVAALDDESARLQAEARAEFDIATGYMAERDAARAALGQVRAEVEMVRGYAALDFATVAGVVLLLDKFAALDPEEPR